MEAPLTENAISSLLSGSVHLQPLLQVFSLQPFGPTNATTPRFRITISDGNNTHQTLLPTTLNSLISNGEIQEGSVIKLSKCTCTVIHNNTYWLLPIILIPLLCSLAYTFLPTTNIINFITPLLILAFSSPTGLLKYLILNWSTTSLPLLGALFLFYYWLALAFQLVHQLANPSAS